MNRLKKVLFYTLIVIVIFLILIIVSNQQYSESYIKKQKEKHGILKNRERISYTPIWFFRFSDMTKENRASNMLYKNVNEPHECNGFIDSYIMHCFYTKYEIDSIISSDKHNYFTYLWEDFYKAFEEKNINYLVKNSFDEIYCSDFYPKVKDSLKMYDPEFVYTEQMDKFAGVILSLKKYNMGSIADDSTFKVVYHIDNNEVVDEKYDIIYLFKKQDNKFKMLGRFIEK